MPSMTKLSNFKTTWFAEGDNGGVTYVNTQIVAWDADFVTLNSGGWRTVTTKRKMNQAAGQFGLGFAVYQKDGEWFVVTRRNYRPDVGYEWGEPVPFVDGMKVAR